MIAAIVDELAPNLVARNAIGHIGAAQLLLTAGDNPERLRSEASFASLCGVSPVPASSGKTVRHRLNRGGDRAAKQRATYHRHRTPTDRPENQGLCYSSDSRRAFQTRRHSSLEALPRPRGLHAHHSASQGDQRYTNRRLTNRRASRARNSPRPPSPARWPKQASRSPWTAAAAGWTTCSSSGCGGR